mmetsp:Transcript_3296/g.11268  ORF Transcript_3296/g.11268 Transcript_3296/m.11268 type:complete len:106 (+) Transcript_3296:2010-2327(+)
MKSSTSRRSRMSNSFFCLHLSSSPFSCLRSQQHSDQKQHRAYNSTYSPDSSAILSTAPDAETAQTAVKLKPPINMASMIMPVCVAEAVSSAIYQFKGENSGVRNV